MFQDIVYEASFRAIKIAYLVEQLSIGYVSVSSKVRDQDVQASHHIYWIFYKRKWDDDHKFDFRNGKNCWHLMWLYFRIYIFFEFSTFSHAYLESIQ